MERKRLARLEVTHDDDPLNCEAKASDMSDRLLNCSRPITAVLLLGCCIPLLGSGMTGCKSKAQPKPTAACLNNGKEVLCQDEYDVLSALLQPRPSPQRQANDEQRNAPSLRFVVNRDSYALNTPALANVYSIPDAVRRSARDCMADFSRANQKAWTFAAKFDPTIKVALMSKKKAHRLFPGTGTRTAAFFTLSRPGFNPLRDRALVSYTTWNGRSLERHHAVLHKKNGRWQIAARHHDEENPPH